MVFFIKGLSVKLKKIPDWVTFPDEDWDLKNLDKLGINPSIFNTWISTLNVKGANFGGEDHCDNKFGTVITRGGYIIHEWGDRNYRFHTASVGKALCWVLIGCAIEDGLIDPDDLIYKTWTGEGELSHSHKYLDQGYHKNLSWRHIIGYKYGDLHFGGFPMEMGIRWKEKRTGLEDDKSIYGIPNWSTWTGDPSYDLYAHIEPGTQGVYSSAGFWRLGQALTSLWNRDLKDVVDERLFSKIGIKSNNWDWYTGEYVKSQKYFYPNIPDSYTYLDPPYTINSIPVRSGPGWIVISASDLARFGHLLATNGNWKGIQLIDPQWLRGHGGGNGSGVSGESDFYTSISVVTTRGIDYKYGSSRKSFLPHEVFSDKYYKGNQL